jgi:MFS family permease
MSDRSPGAIEAIRVASGRGGIIGAWLVLIVALSGAVLSSFQTAVVAPLGSRIAEHFGGGNQGAMVAQLTITLPAIGVIVGGVVSAGLLARFGYRPVIVGCAAVLAVAGSSGLWLDAMIPFLAARLLVGFSAVILFGGLTALTGRLFTGATLSRMISYQTGASAFSGMAWVLLSGWIASHFGWRASFCIYWLTALFAILALFVWLPSKAEPGAARGGGWAALRPVVPALLLNMGTFAIIFMVIIQGSLLMAANGIKDPSLQSMVIALSTLTNGMMGTLFSWVEARLFGRFTYPLALGLLAAGVVTMGAVPTLWGAALGALLLGLGSGLASSYLIKLVVERSPPGTGERAAGLIAPFRYVGQFANPLVMQSLRMAIGVHGAFILVGAVMFGAAGWAFAHARRAGGAANG